MENFGNYLTVNEAAKKLGVSPSTVRNWDRSGKLRSIRHPYNSYRIYREEDIDYILSTLHESSFVQENSPVYETEKRKSIPNEEIQPVIDFKNKVIQGDCIEEMKKFPDNYFDLIIADPPYWKVVGEKWDYKWRTEEDYISWSYKWLKEAYRILRYGGSFYLFGYFRMLVFLIPLLQNLGFSLRQQIVINKGMKAVAGRATKNYKMFPNVTESVLFLVKDNIRYSRELLKSRQKELNLSSKEINEALGVKSNGGGMWSIYTGKNICEQFPTEQLWDKLQKILQFTVPYKSIAQTYNPEMGITDVWNDIDFYSEKRIHPTQKPLRLIDRIVKASSNRGDKILDPFAGSGTTLLSSYNNGRNAIVIEIDADYVQRIKKRIEYETSLLF